MEVAQAQEGNEIELDLSIRISFDSIANSNGIALPEEEHFLDDFDPFQLVIESNGTVELKAAEVFLAMGMEGVAKLINRELEEGTVAVEIDELADAVHGIDAAEGRQGGGDEQPVIAAGVAANESGRGESADAVGEQPFGVEEGVEMAVRVEGK